MKFLLSALVIVLAITVITAEENSNKRGIFSRIRNSTKWKSIKDKFKMKFHSEDDETKA